MTTATVERRSAYPPAVEALVPRARTLAESIGVTPSRHRLMKEFRIGVPKAELLLDALRADFAPAPSAAEPDTSRADETPAAAIDSEPVGVAGPGAPRQVTKRPVRPEHRTAPKTPTAVDGAGGEADRQPIREADTAPSIETAGQEDTSTAVGDPAVGAKTASRRTSPVRSLILGAVPFAALAGYVAVTPAVPEAVQAWPQARIGAVALVLLVLYAGLSAAVHAVRGIKGRSSRDVALDLASWVVAGVAGFLAAFGQVKFAEWAGVTGGMKWFVPAILEPSVVVLLLLANRRIKRARDGKPSRPIGSLLGLAALLGGFAVYTNVVHAGGRAGLVFGAATVVGLILWWVKLNDEAAPGEINDAPQSTRLSRRTARYRWLRWVILPNQTRRAWLISLDYSVTDAEHGLDLARDWRRQYDLARATGQSRGKARRAAAAALDARMAAC